MSRAQAGCHSPEVSSPGLLGSQVIGKSPILTHLPFGEVCGYFMGLSWQWERTKVWVWVCQMGRWHQESAFWSSNQLKWSQSKTADRVHPAGHLWLCPQGERESISLPWLEGTSLLVETALHQESGDLGHVSLHKSCHPLWVSIFSIKNGRFGFASKAPGL